MPKGYVRWFSSDKGYGFVTSEEEGDAFLHASALPEGVDYVEEGTKVEFSVIDSKRGATVSHLEILQEPPSLSKGRRKSPDEMVPILEDAIVLLENVSDTYRKGAHPDRAFARKVSMVLRGIAKDLS
jgi:CspA family cold shock protein